MGLLLVQGKFTKQILLVQTGSEFVTLLDDIKSLILDMKLFATKLPKQNKESYKVRDIVHLLPFLSGY